MSPNDFNYGQLMKIEWLVTYVTPVGSPDRAERGIFGVILDVFWSVQVDVDVDVVISGPGSFFVCPVKGTLWRAVKA